jgi:hypothetical protein
VDSDRLISILPSSGAVLGIDVGYSPTKPTTGLCALSWTATEVSWRCANATLSPTDRLRAVAEVLPDHAPVLAVAIDGPLRPGLAVDTQRYRAAECLLSRGLFQRRGKPGQTHAGSGPLLHSHATALAWFALGHCTVGRAAWISRIHETALAEAFPNLFLGFLCNENDYPTRPKIGRRWTDALYPLVADRLTGLLWALLPARALVGTWPLQGHEPIAAFTCALTALCAAAQHYVAVGSHEDGFIVLPPLGFWGRDSQGTARWPERELRRNYERIRGSLFPSRERVFKQPSMMFSVWQQAT